MVAWLQKLWAINKQRCLKPAILNSALEALKDFLYAYQLNVQALCRFFSLTVNFKLCFYDLAKQACYLGFGRKYVVELQTTSKLFCYCNNVSL